MVLLWLVDQFSTFTEKNSMTSYLQGNRDGLIMSIFFYKLDEYLFLARNRQSSTWFIFSPFLYVQVLSLLVSTLWVGQVGVRCRC